MRAKSRRPSGSHRAKRPPCHARARSIGGRFAMATGPTSAHARGLFGCGPWRRPFTGNGHSYMS